MRTNNIFLISTPQPLLGILIALSVVLLIAFPVFAEDTSVPGNFDTIQKAIDAIANGSSTADTIVVNRATYSENITLISDITLRGEETARTFLEAKSADSPVIRGDSVANVTLRNFTFINSAKAIEITNSTNITITNNVFDVESSGDGVIVTDGSTVVIKNNTFFDNATAVTRTSNLTDIKNNIFSDNRTAISTEGVTGNITFNCFTNNGSIGNTGSDSVTGNNARFVDTGNRDFHLKENSPCIDQGTGLDNIDGSDADMGAWGGDLADAKPYQVQGLTATDATVDAGVAAVDLSWNANNAYLITQTANPGKYKLYYDSDKSGAPYNGIDGESAASPSPVDVGNVTSFRLSNLSPANTIPDVPLLQSIEPSNQRLEVHWQAATGATGYNIQFGINDTGENEVTVGNVTSHALTGLVNGATYRATVTSLAKSFYYFSITAVDNTPDANESDYSAEVSVALGTERQSIPSNELTAIPEEVIPYPILPDEGCFIATATYGYYDAAEVKILRAFRDRYLLNNDAGRMFVRVYYRHGPKLAAVINDYPQLKPYVSAILYPLVGFSYFMTEASWPLKVLMLFILLFVLVKVSRLDTLAVMIFNQAGEKWARFFSCLLCLLLSLLLSTPLLAEVGKDNKEPTWSLALKWGEFTPEIKDWDHFYGDDNTTHLNTSLSYKIRRWLEIGLDGGYIWDNGKGYLPLNGMVGGEVKYELFPLQFFVLLRGIYKKDQLIVPYIGGGWSQVYYRETIDGQSDVKGSTDGTHIRGGLQFLLDRIDPGRSGELQKDFGIDNSYIILEYQQMEATVGPGSIDIGGDSYIIGLLFEF